MELRGNIFSALLLAYESPPLCLGHYKAFILLLLLLQYYYYYSRARGPRLYRYVTARPINYPIISRRSPEDVIDSVLRR